ncbi:MAG: hypothetical protein KC478_16600 [Bacteriovoracaceae bacterium]|nr:hypothetical protein [Bacteriovoracaceae bacterium]
MKLTKAITGIALILMSLQTFASREGGNGGDIIDGQLLDLTEDHSQLYEDLFPDSFAKEYFPFKDQSIKAELEHVKEVLKDILFFDFWDELHESHGSPGEFLIRMAQEDMNWYLMDELPEVNDEGDIHTPNSKAKKQLAVQSPNEGKVYIHEGRYNSLKAPKHKAALIFHEIMIAYSNQQSVLEFGTEPIRVITKLALTEEAPFAKVFPFVMIMKDPHSKEANIFRRSKINKDFKRENGSCVYDHSLNDKLTESYHDYNLDLSLGLGTNVGLEATFEAISNIKTLNLPTYLDRFIKNTEELLKSSTCTKLNILNKYEFSKSCIAQVRLSYRQILSTYEAIGEEYGCSY